MSYKRETQYNSPNFTRGADASKVWGRPYVVTAIAIHWWGDPNTNPSYEGVINTLCNPKRGASAHFVATGTGRRVAQLVDLSNASWATNGANPFTVSIECDPRCRNEDYDVIAELIAQIRQVFGKDLPLVPHRQFHQTQCPGNYDLARLDREARNKVAKPEWDWGHVENKVTEQPKPVPVQKPSWTSMDKPRTLIASNDLHVFNLVSGANVGDTIKKGTPIEFQTKTAWNGKTYLRSKSSTEAGRDWGILETQLSEIPVVEPPVEVPVTPPTTSPEAPGGGFTESDRTMLQDIKVLLEQLSVWFKRIFNIGDK